MPNSTLMKELVSALLLLLILGGCANYGTPKNIDIPDPRSADRYSLHDWREEHNDSDIRFILTFSGGGTRAAALSYGVMQELRDTKINYEGQNLPVLISQLETYDEKDKRRFVHFVYGGITDNLGLRAVSDIMAASGGSDIFHERNEKRRGMSWYSWSTRQPRLVKIWI